jgi:hypothetical protein
MMAGKTITSIHTFRLSMAPVALALAQVRPVRPRLTLDLDDLEAHTHQRIADLAQRNGDQAIYRRYQTAARSLGRWERRLLPRFDRIYVCSETDRAALGLPTVRVLPNIAPTCPPLPRREPASGYRALFLGSLGYYPNEDALRQIRTLLLPLLRDDPIEILSAGIGGDQRTADLLTPLPGYRHLGRLPTAAEAFAQTDCVITPLRAGGGTRLKILESFAHGRPVISTRVGIEGIAALPGQHYLPAESAADFAHQIRTLASNPGLGARLAHQAHNLVAQHYSPAAVDAALAP